MKQYLTIQEQIEHLKQNKNVEFDDYDDAFNYLSINNYYNFINPVKMHFVIGSINSKHIYDNSNFENWIKINNENIKVELRILTHILVMERKIRSFLSEHIPFVWLNDTIETNLSIEYQSAIIYRMKSAKKWVEHDHFIVRKGKKSEFVDNELRKYYFNNAWKYCSKLTFTDIIKLTGVLSDADLIQLTNIIGINLSDDSIRGDLIELRNKLAHNTPFYYFLSTNRVSARSRRKRLVLSICSNDEICISYLNNRHAVINRYIKNTQNKNQSLI